MRNLHRSGLVYTNERCIGCNKCIRSCSCIGANIPTEPDANGGSRIEVDGNRCVACGACFDTCEHNARDFCDDTDRFFEDLEGMEQWDQVDFLKSINVKLVQGFLFDKPLTKEDFEGRLKNKVYQKKPEEA